MLCELMQAFYSVSYSTGVYPLDRKKQPWKARWLDSNNGVRQEYTLVHQRGTTHTNIYKLLHNILMRSKIQISVKKFRSPALHSSWHICYNSMKPSHTWVQVCFQTMRPWEACVDFYFLVILKPFLLWILFLQDALRYFFCCCLFVLTFQV